MFIWRTVAPAATAASANLTAKDRRDSIHTSRRFFLLPKGVTDDEVGETHWVVKNGIRFSAMPSFESKLTDTQIWQVSLLLRNADKLPASLQALLTK